MRDRDDVPPVRDQLREVGGLVLVALPLDEVGLRILVSRPLELAPRDRKLELRQMLALEERVQIRRREEDVAVALLHHGSITVARAARPRPGGLSSYAAATLRATSNNSSGIDDGNRHVNATGRSPRWST